jgi:hypothetical protein
MVDPGLQWHPALYAGSAHYYAIGRINYPTALDPKPPHPMIEELIERYLGPINRARKGLLPPDKAHREDEVWRQPASRGLKGLRFPAEWWSARANKLWQPSSRSPARLPTCSVIAAKRSKMIFGSCCMMLIRAASLASRRVKSPRTSGDRVGLPNDIRGAA